MAWALVVIRSLSEEKPRVGLSLLQKYGVARLPRYTSYPTAPHFSSEIDAAVHAGWLSGLPAHEPVSLYLHIP